MSLESEIVEKETKEEVEEKEEIKKNKLFKKVFCKKNKMDSSNYITCFSYINRNKNGNFFSK